MKNSLYTHLMKQSSRPLFAVLFGLLLNNIFMCQAQPQTSVVSNEIQAPYSSAKMEGNLSSTGIGFGNDNGSLTDVGNWYYYDDGVNTDAIGTGGGEFWWAVMFPAGSYQGRHVVKVAAYDYMAMSGDVIIYNDGTNAPANPVGSRSVSFTGSHAFAEFEFTAPVVIDPTKNIWVVFHNVSSTYPAAVCASTGDANGRWVSTDNVTWDDLASIGFDYTWMIRVFIDTFNYYDFEDGTLQSWTTIDANNDGYDWVLGSQAGGIYLVTGGSLYGTGHNSSADMICSGSYSNVTNQAITPDNYIVSPQVTLGGSFSFYACAQDAAYPSEHFGVAVSTTNNTSASAFTTIQEWTMTAKGAGVPTDYTRSGNRTQGNWYQFTVDLSAYAGQTGYVAIRHFNCTDMFILNVDDITLVEGSSSVSYTISASATPANGGTVSGAGTYNQGQICTLTATPAANYTFVKWTKNGQQVSTNPTYSFTVTANASYVAHFQYQPPTNTFTITVSANPSNGGTVTGGGTYNQGQTCTLTATAATNYTFVKWTKNNQQVSTNSTYSFTVTENASYVAHFQYQPPTNIFTITVSANPSNGGTVTGGGTYNQGQTCTLTATAATNFDFVKWTKNGQQVSTNPIYSFTVTANANYVAHFQQQSPTNTYTIIVEADPEEGGSVLGGGVYNQNQSCTLMAIPKEGYRFQRWVKNGGSLVSNSPDYTFQVTENATYTAHFLVLSSYYVQAVADPDEGGSVTGYGEYQHGDECTLTASAASGFHFVRWTENGNEVTTDPSFSFVVNGDRSFIAQFRSNTYTVSVSPSPSNAGVVSGGGTYYHNQLCTVLAVPNPGYVFASWVQNGVIESRENPYSFVVDQNWVLQANFIAASSFVISASAGANGSISPQGDIEVPSGGEKTFTITPNFGCLISSVFVDGVDFGPLETYTFTNVSANHTISAVFSGWGVEESQAVGVMVYPNPTKDRLTVEGQDIARIQVFNLQGEKIIEVEGTDIVSLKKCSNGTYVVLVTLRDGRQCFSRVVLSK